MTKKSFFVGLVSGIVLAYHWRVIAKEGIKVGIQAGRKVREISQQAMEDIEDIAAEATEEASEPYRATKEGGPRG